MGREVCHGVGVPGAHRRALFVCLVEAELRSQRWVITARE